MRLFRCTSIPLVLILIAAAGCAHRPDPYMHSRAKAMADDMTALDVYVHKPDPNYQYTLVNSSQENGYTSYVFELISQQYLTEAEINHTIWRHWLLVAKPETVVSDKAMLYISGGNLDSPQPEGVDERYAQIAMATGTVTAVLHGVPNQRIQFADETRTRTEDSFIAYTWDRYLRTGDEKWPLRLPMTKSAVRAMDAIQDYFANAEDTPIEQFVVAGGSKRGWTAWTTAITDTRVTAVVPIVIDMLNVTPSFIHHWEVYGFWAPAVGDYVEMGTMDWHGSPEADALYALVEPYSYRHRFQFPKFIMNATGDEFFLPDSSQFYFDDLPGEKHLRYVPNSKHSMGGTDAFETLLAYYYAIVHGVPRPTYSWTIGDDHSIRVVTREQPAEVRLWHATNPDTRDFRVDTIGNAWESEILPDLGGGVYIGRVETPESGWTAFFVEMTYPMGGPTPFKFTTQVHVVPDVKPFTYEQPAWPAGGFIRDATK